MKKVRKHNKSQLRTLILASLPSLVVSSAALGASFSKIAEKDCSFSTLNSAQNFVQPTKNSVNLFKNFSGNNKFNVVQSQIGADWFNDSPSDIDPVTNERIEGSEINNVYDRLVEDNLQEVIVAVIDSGMDISHKDLKANIWTNPKEIPGNCIDDDNNGYIDDIHGWNYLVKADGSKITGETLEVTRELARLRAAGETKSEYYKKVKTEFNDSVASAVTNVKRMNHILNELNTSASMFSDDIHIYTKSEVERLNATTAIEKAAKQTLINYLDKLKSRGMDTVGKVIEYYEGAKTYYKENLDFYYNLSLAKNPHRNDDPDFFGSFIENPEKLYGNNDVTPADNGENHSTHVAGIIGAVRGNNIGINGVASKVKLMALRAVPNGDESDKDIFHAVKYAVDNGAKVINMSFGKGFSRNSDKVIEAFDYAASKGVLLVHSAGNGRTDNDTGYSYPERKLIEKSSNLYKHWLEIGASTAVKGSSLKAGFSNFGKETVDVFAPGSKVKSTITDNKYAYYSGTSMASPVVAGAAALMLSYDPSLTGSQLKEKIMSTSRQYPDVIVSVSTNKGEMKEIPFQDLSISGGVLNGLELFDVVQ